MRALVLGGTGFIGRHLCERLRAAGHEVTVFARTPARQGRSIIGDFTDPAAVADAVRGQDWVFHLVWTTLPRSSNEAPLFDLQSNLAGTLGMLDACTRAGVRKVVFASSGGTVYGVSPADRLAEDAPCHPICCYGVTKLLAEKYLYLWRHRHGLEYVVLRVSNPYGEGQDPGGEQGAIGVFMGRICRGEPITIFGDGSVVRDYVYIGDVAEAFVTAAGTSSAQRVFNIGSGQGISLNDLLRTIGSVTGRVPSVQHAAGRSLDVPRVVLDVSRARRDMGWQPCTPLTAGLQRTWAWVQQSAGGPRRQAA